MNRTLRRAPRALLPLAFGLLAACGAEAPPTPAAGTSEDRAPQASVAPAPAATETVPSASTEPPRAVAAEPSDAVASAAADARAPAAVTPPAATQPTAWAPDTLSTGHDLSSLRIAKTAPPPPAAASKGLLVAEGDALIELGALVQGEVVHHSFVLENQGEGPITITATHNSCGCSVSSTARVQGDGNRVPYVVGEPIQVGERIEIAVRVDSHGKSGTLTNVVTLQTDGPVPVQLRLNANVEPFLVLDPAHYITLQSMRSDEQQSAEFSVRSSSQERIGLRVEPVGLPAYVQATLEPVEPDESGRAASWKCHVTVGPGVPEGHSQGWSIQLVSDVPAVGQNESVVESGRMHRTATYVVVPEVTGLVRLSPPYLSFGMVRPGQTVTRTVRVESLDASFTLPDEMPVRLAERSMAHQELIEASLSWNLETIEPGKVVDVHVTITDLPDTFAGSLSSGVEVEIGHPSKPVATVLFSAICRPHVTGPAGTANR